MIRSLQSSDGPDVVSLLSWMDGAPEREVFAPDARTPDDLALENSGKTCLVTADDLGSVTAFAALSPFQDGLLLEGPLSETPGNLPRLLGAALKHSDNQSVYAFAARDNVAVRGALEAAAFLPMHSTDFYRLSRGQLGAAAALTDGLLIDHSADTQTYRALYRAAEDTWSERLHWSEAQLLTHLHSPDVQISVLRRGGKALGFAETELDGDLARMTYLAVHPAERGQGHGKTLLMHAAKRAFERPEVRAVQVRAHDHEGPARTLYTRAGFLHSRSVVTYLLEPEGEEA
ncbi:GNAT family N-acetyltransferase [Deinococcus psychrotolerans]|uniref:GNAT family N-acetyltransferase n=1 Tax=Deinococcus psychrotolerans TaxID=2489213 RepID=A0A3G8Y907_9DEIO|nr:GNAT family N-acetyltransferase [Deinococcus psychrotolerans]AZI41440.1 GNAT family N-acetyltransferase [Deinococcus psychrotolerans]